MKSDLKQGLADEVLDEAGREVAEKVRDQTIKNLRSSYQGAEELPRYVGDVKQNRGAGGKFASGFSFSINHPTAELHERGGHIEPKYANAMAMGWDRDGFYECLDDCNEWVEPKHPVRNAAYSVKLKEE